MGWVKLTVIGVIVALAAGGTVFGVQQYQAGKKAAAAKALALQKARVTAARTLLKASQSSKSVSGQRRALETLHRAGAPPSKLRLGCIDARGRRQQDRCAALAKIDLSASDGKKPFILSGIDLSGANLRQANLFWVEFKAANLRGADFKGAKLYRVNFNGADLSRADLAGADLLYTDFLDANLSGANLSGAKNLRQTRLDRACLGNPKQPPINLPAGLKAPGKRC
jgi:uncharacterized protein YjbI with pentapeptide repeats